MNFVKNILELAFHFFFFFCFVLFVLNEKTSHSKVNTYNLMTFIQVRGLDSSRSEDQINHTHKEKHHVTHINHIVRYTVKKPTFPTHSNIPLIYLSLSRFKDENESRWLWNKRPENPRAEKKTLGTETPRIPMRSKCLIGRRMHLWPYTCRCSSASSPSPFPPNLPTATGTRTPRGSQPPHTHQKKKKNHL